MSGRLWTFGQLSFRRLEARGVPAAAREDFMVARLRTLIASWPSYTWVGLSFGLFIAIAEGVKRCFPAVLSWPWSVSIVITVEFIGILVLCMVFGHIVAEYVVFPFLNRTLDVKVKSRSDKAKEKWAESLMKIGTTVDSATLITILVFPLTVFIQGIASGTDPVSALRAWWAGPPWSWWHTALLVSLFFVPEAFSRQLQRQALDLYDEISSNTPSCASALPPKSVDDRATVLSQLD